MFGSIQHKVIFFLIKKETRSNKPAGRKPSIREAKRIGLITVLDDEEKFKEAIQLKKDLEKQNKEVKAIGYVPAKVVPGYYLAQMQIDIFSRKNLNIFGIPKNVFVKEFLGQQYDILIDLSVDDHLPVHYIAGFAKASVKVGKYRKKMLMVYDFMIKSLEDMKYGDFVKNLLSYLSKLNTTKS